jgi:hypothetical protein
LTWRFADWLGGCFGQGGGEGDGDVEGVEGAEVVGGGVGEHGHLDAGVLVAGLGLTPFGRHGVRRLVPSD